MYIHVFVPTLWVGTVSQQLSAIVALPGLAVFAKKGLAMRLYISSIALRRHTFECMQLLSPSP